MSSLSISPILFLFPPPKPIFKDIAPLPLVFQGIFGFNLTRRGYPIKLNPSFINSLIIVFAMCVVQPPFIESVSSIPIQIFSTPILLYIKQ
jgi:hypothetical protein